MIFYEIPYEQGNTQTWHLDGLAEGRKDFDSRVAALAFAMQSNAVIRRAYPSRVPMAIGARSARTCFRSNNLPRLRVRQADAHTDDMQNNVLGVTAAINHNRL